MPIEKKKRLFFVGFLIHGKKVARSVMSPGEKKHDSTSAQPMFVTSRNWVMALFCALLAVVALMSLSVQFVELMRVVKKKKLFSLFLTQGVFMKKGSADQPSCCEIFHES